MKNDETTIDDLINSLSVSNINNGNNKIVEYSEPVQEDYNEKVILQNAIKGLNELIEQNKEILEENAKLVTTTGDKDYFDTYASVSKSQSEAYKNIVKIITDKEKNRILKETKEKEIQVKEKLVDFQIGELESKKNALPAGATLNQTNIIMPGASREQALEFVKNMQLAEKEIIQNEVVIDV